MTTYRVHFNHAGDTVDVEATNYQITEGTVVFTGGATVFIVSLDSLSYVEELLPPD